MQTKINRLSDGLDKLRMTSETVAEISAALEEQLVRVDSDALGQYS